MHANKRVRFSASLWVPAASAAEIKSESTSVSPVPPIAPPCVRIIRRDKDLFVSEYHTCSVLPVRNTQIEFTRLCVMRNLNLPPIYRECAVLSDRPLFPSNAISRSINTTFFANDIVELRELMKQSFSLKS